MIYSIGYQNITLKQLRAVMTALNITLLIDVRSVPYSRRPDKYEFNKNRLVAALNDRYFDTYIWEGDKLGGKYGPAKEEGIRFLILNEAHNALLLMCMEDDPRNCHRYTDIGVRLLKFGIDVVHIYKDREITTTELMKEQNP